MREVVIVEGCRTAVGRRKGALSEIRSDELLALVLDELTKRAGIDKAQVEDVIAVCVIQVNEQEMNVARTALLIAGYPEHVPGETIERQCGSTLQSVHYRVQTIAAEGKELDDARMVSRMTRAPMYFYVGDMTHSEKLTKKHQIVNQGISAEMIADQRELSRKKLDDFALQSHQRSINAIESGHYEKEIVPVEIENECGEKEIFNQDEGPRQDTTSEILNGLKSVFKEDGKITAGNASQMSDGASAVLLMSREKADELNLKPKAKINARTVIGSDPTLMLTGPIAATRKVLNKAGLKLTDMDRFEVNEAFASVPLAWQHDLNADPEKLNVNGGAIALGHPLGATGTKLLVSLVNELERIEGRYGLLAICEGMGMANATVIERI